MQTSSSRKVNTGFISSNSGFEIPAVPVFFYHRLLHHYFKFLIPSGRKVMELGCGQADMPAAVKPSLEVDISTEKRYNCYTLIHLFHSKTDMWQKNCSVYVLGISCENRGQHV